MTTYYSQVEDNIKSSKSQPSEMKTLS
jgi:hypothetical protein